ncbi:MAG TPA: enoyl-CoA hydratase/isomerase family protein [Anaerolineae bacterium]|nr:enoyl-CoA hydratase/isomerase family protein [Anaerolineae bacterium]
METIQLDMKGPVAWVWLDQPRRLNAINQTTLAELRQTFEALDGDDEVAAVILAARGLAFSAGFDVAWMAGQDAGTVGRGLPDVEAVYDAIEACAKPVIAAVQGAAMGGGLLLILVADFCLASEEASFGAPEVKIGIFPNLRLIPRLERIVGLRAAKRMVLIGDPVSATEAQAMGLVDRVLPSGKLHAEAQALAEQLAALPPMAVQTAKAAFSAARGPKYPAWERIMFTACWEQPERQAAMQAFLQARKR